MRDLRMRSCRRGKLVVLREALTKVHAGATSGEVKALIDTFATGEPAGPVAAMQSRIDRWFAHDRMEDIAAALRRDGSEQAEATLKTLIEKSPRGLVVTLRLLRLARASSSLEECLTREYRAALEVVSKRRFSRRRARGRDRQGPQSPMVAVRNRGCDAGNACALPQRDRRRRTQVRQQEIETPQRGEGRETMANVAFIGLGNMGGPMAANLVKAGQKVTGFDLVEASRNQAKADGAGIADSAASAVTGAEVVITMLPAGKHVLSVWSEILPRDGRWIVDHRLLDHRRRKREASPRACGETWHCFGRCAGVRWHRWRQGRDADLYGGRRRQGVRSREAGA